jgi:hypothetical protein
VNQVINAFELPTQWFYHPWEGPWAAQALFNRFSVWFPPPEVARQAIIFVLESWVECPLTTAALFFVPRTLSHAWSGLSRHLVELGTWRPSEFDLTHPPLLPIPFVVLYLGPFSRTVSLDRGQLDHRPISGDRRLHVQQAEDMRGLQGISLEF